MTNPYDHGVDTIHADVMNVPNTVPYVMGYVTGTGDVPWTTEDWDRFHTAVHIRINQDPHSTIPLTEFDVIDVETGAFTPQEAADLIERRVNAGIVWTTVYADGQNAADTAAAVKAKGDHIWIGHVDLWYADWNLSETQAVEILGTEVYGMTCRAVQWASPTSNPDTIIYGGESTLKQANADLSVVQYRWVPDSFPPPPPPAPTPPPETLMHMVGVVLPTGVTMNLESSDGGSTWRKS